MGGIDSGGNDGRDGRSGNVGNGAANSFIVSIESNSGSRWEGLGNRVGVVAKEAARHAAVRAKASRPVGQGEARFVKGEGLWPVVGFREGIVEEYRVGAIIATDGNASEGHGLCF